MTKFIHLNLLAGNYIVVVNVANITCVHSSVDDAGAIRGTVVRMTDGNHVEVSQKMFDVLSLIPRG